MSLNESIVEDATMTWFGALGYAIGHGLHMAPGELRVKDDVTINTTRGISFG